jgi:hypothetical protein
MSAVAMGQLWVQLVQLVQLPNYVPGSNVGIRIHEIVNTHAASTARS